MLDRTRPTPSRTPSTAPSPWCYPPTETAPILHPAATPADIPCRGRAIAVVLPPTEALRRRSLHPAATPDDIRRTRHRRASGSSAPVGSESRIEPWALSHAVPAPEVHAFRSAFPRSLPSVDRWPAMRAHRALRAVHETAANPRVMPQRGSARLPRRPYRLCMSSRRRRRDLLAEAFHPIPGALQPAPSPWCCPPTGTPSVLRSAPRRACPCLRLPSAFPQSRFGRPPASHEGPSCPARCP